MGKQTLILKISNGRVFFNPDFSIPLTQTNIPVKDLGFKTYRDFYWLVKMESFDSKNKQLFVNVQEYDADPSEEFNQQQPKDEVRLLFFRDLDWHYLEPQLSFYTKNKLRSIVKNIPIEHVDAKFESINVDISPSLQKSIIRFKFDVSFADVSFNFGYAEVEKYITQLNQEINFQILNDHLLPEFNHIKSWFAKKIGTRKIKVNTEIQVIDGEIEKKHATSKEIEAISSELIDSIKQQRTLEFSKRPRVIQPDKTLFTSEDIFDQFDEDKSSQGNVFTQSEKDILEVLLANQNIRNRQQLIYLSGAKQSENEKIRFTLNPHFGFLFLVEGEQCNHFVWELLNSHATYIWSIDKKDQEIKLQYQRIEQSINTIRNSSREAYKNAYRQQNVDQDLVFNVLKHTHADSSLVDGFPKWKHRLNELLV